MALTNISNLHKYLDIGYNVLFKGEHGIGKTAIIKQVFEKAGLKWAYFSASTLDPWTDLIGVPKEIPNPNDPGSNVLGFIRPELFQNDQIEAIFFDELNRANPKVLNAIMELIQFKSINGFKLKNLKVVWAAINPDDAKGTYSVEYLDPAQIDRFHVQIDLRTDVDTDYFKKKYPHIAAPVIQWWQEMPADIRKEVSPRRLDYIADALMNQCRIEDFVVGKANVGKLRSLIGDTVSVLARFDKAMLDEKHADILMADANAMLRLNKVSPENVEELNKKYPGKVSEEMIAAVSSPQKSTNGDQQSLRELIADQIAMPSTHWFRILPPFMANNGFNALTQMEVDAMGADEVACVGDAMTNALLRMKGDSLIQYFKPTGSVATPLVTLIQSLAMRSINDSSIQNIRKLVTETMRNRFANLTESKCPL